MHAIKVILDCSKKSHSNACARIQRIIIITHTVGLSIVMRGLALWLRMSEETGAELLFISALVLLDELLRSVTALVRSQ